MKNVIVSVIVSVLITAGGLWYYDHHYATHIAVFDMNNYLSALKKDYVAGKLPREELQKRIANLKSNASSSGFFLRAEIASSGSPV